MARDQVIPPPPDGFIVDEAPAAAQPSAVAADLTPPPPPGFVIDKAPESIGVPTFSKVDAPAAQPSWYDGAVDATKRLATATANTVIPTSLEAAKQVLDPRAGRAGASRFMEQEGARVQDAVTAAGANMSNATNVITPEPGNLHATAHPFNAAEIIAPGLKPSAWQEQLGMEGLSHVMGLGTAAVKAGLALHSDNFAVNMARRALGYTKRFFKEPGDVARANDVAREMLSQSVKDPVTGKMKGIITPNTEAMMQRAEILSNKAGKEIGAVIDKLEKAGVGSAKVDDLVNEVVTQLDPGKSGGAYDRQKAIVKEIVDTINAHEGDVVYDGRLGFNSVQKLKQTLKGEANFDKVTDAKRAHLYRRAYGIVREAIDNSVAGAQQLLGPQGTNVLRDYLGSKGVYGKAEEALGAITNKLGTELGNNIWGLRETIIGAGQLAAGNPIKAAATVAAKPVIQGGAAVAANMAKGLATYLKRVPPNNRAFIIRAVVRSGLVSEARKLYDFSKNGIKLPPEPQEAK